LFPKLHSRNKAKTAHFFERQECPSELVRYFLVVEVFFHSLVATEEKKEVLPLMIL
jgi:hypothetical protein